MICSKCGVDKPESDFRKKNNGYVLKQCKLCWKEYMGKWYEENKERQKEKRKKYRENNKENIRLKKKEYHKKNKDKICAKAKKWREENMERASETRKKYYEANKEELLYKQKKYVRENINAYKERQKKWRNNNIETIKMEDKKYHDKDSYGDNATIIRLTKLTLKGKITQGEAKKLFNNLDKPEAIKRIYSININNYPKKRSTKWTELKAIL